MMQSTAELDGSADGRNPSWPVLGKGAWWRFIVYMDGGIVGIV